MLSEGPKSIPELSERLSLPPDAAERLLRAASALRLASDRGDGRFSLGALGAALIGNPGVAGMVRHHQLLYADLADPVALLRSGDRQTRLSGFWPYALAGGSDELAALRVADYSALMSVSQPLVTDEILDAYPLKRHRCILDIGGGEGRFARAACARWPGLRAVSFDLPPVADLAHSAFQRDGLNGRATAVGGDFRSDPLPAGADVVSLIRVIHDHDDAVALRLLRSIREILPPNGKLILAEPMAGTRNEEPSGDAYFGFYLLAMGSGRPRTSAELTLLLLNAGFAQVTQIPTRMPLLVRILVARPGEGAAPTVKSN